MTATPLEIVGAHASPYSRKLRAVLRYRRIPFRWIVRNSKDDIGTPDLPVSLIPVLVFPTEGSERSRAMVDSTFQIRRLEELYRERSVIPPDPALAFVDALLEDYADEWLTKAMFHYRWAFAPDVAKASAILPRWGRIHAPDDKVAALSEMFRQRQVGRLGVVGSSPTTAPVIEASYRRLLAALDARLARHPFVLGDRPGSADFGLFGQLSQLAQFDPTSMALTLELAPRVFAWCDVMEDLSGYEVSPGDWIRRDEAHELLRGLLDEAGRTYAPFLIANAAALERRDAQLTCEIDGRPWSQKPFPYQGKCLGWLRDGYGALSEADRRWVDELLAGTGCEALFEA
jgi:glutathione S-transferase